MHQVSAAYQKILVGEHWVETVLQVGSDADVTSCWSIPGTVYGTDMICKIVEKGDILNQEAPGIGCFISRKLEITMLNPSQSISVMGRIVPYSRLVSGDGVSEWIPKGVFYIDTRKKAMVEADAATVSITAYDAALKASDDYDTAGLSWPAKDADVVADIAGKIGVQVDKANIDAGFTIPAPEDKTSGEVLCGIAALYGGNFTVDDCGVLRLLPLGKSGEPIQIEAGKLKMSTPSDPVSGVVLHVESGGKYTAGSGKMLQAQSPWASQAAAEKALSAVNGYSYQAFSARQAILAPHMELGDYVRVGQAAETMYSYYLDLATCIGDISAPEEYEINREYPYRSTASRAGSAARTAQRLAREAAGNIIENYNQLIAALNGEDGVPEDLAAGLKNYVRYDLKNGDMLAHSQLIAQIGEKAKAEISVYAVESGGETKTFVEILADQISLESEMADAKAALELKANSTDLETVTGELQNVQTAQANLTTRVGNAETALTQKAEKTTVDALDGRVTATEEAQAALTTRVGNAETALTQKVSARDFQDAIDNQDEAIAGVQDAQTALTTRVGNVETGLSQKVSTADLTAELKNYALASALADYLTVEAAQELYVTDGDVTAAIGAYIVNDGAGNKATLAAILADVIQLQGDTEIVGNLTISDGRLRVDKGVIANGNSNIWGDLAVSGKLFVNQNNLYIGGEQYLPTSITSTSGTEYTVLGA